MSGEENVYGRFIEGSVERGINVLLSDSEDVEDYPVGSLVKIVGKKYEFLALITNTRVDSSKEGIDLLVNTNLSTKVKELMIKTIPSGFRRQILEMTLIAKKEINNNENIGKADVLPSFNSPMTLLSEADLTAFYGAEPTYLIGTPKTPKVIDVNIPINIEKLIDLSFGIFGKSGSGKTFLGNILAGYIFLHDLKIDKTMEKGVKLLIFDMQSEYGLELRDNRGNKIADGIGNIFKDYFERYTPDLGLAKERGLKPFKINITQITPSDIALIAPIFGISRTFLDHLQTIYNIISRKLFRGEEKGLGEFWFFGLFEGDHIKEKLEERENGEKIISKLEEKLGSDLSELRRIVVNALERNVSSALKTTFVSQTSKLRRLLDYPITIDEDPVGDIVRSLLDREGSHVIISLGKYEKEMPLYMIIANLIARRLRDEILKREIEGNPPENKVIIFLEEAHNFLSRDTYHISPFGEIAREMRKKGVTLCIIDQKPGELDPNVVSMLWTNFVFNLTDKRDIEQAILGVDRPELFRKIVPTLSPKEVFVYGEAVRFPTVVTVRNYKEVEKSFREKNKKINEEKSMKEEILRKHKLL